MKADVVVIGGGIIGVSCAYALARSGINVVLLEAGEICTGSSYGNAGLVCPCHSSPIPGPGVLSQGIRWMMNPESPFYIRPSFDRELITWLWQFRRFCSQESVDRAVPVLRDMQRASLALYEDWLRETRIEPEYEKAGGLELFLTQKRFNRAQKEVEHMQAFGLRMNLLDRNELLSLEPAVTPDIVGGIHYLEDAHLNPARFVDGLASEAEKYGAKIVTQTPVLGLVRDGASNLLVRTSSIEYESENIVAAAGAWTPKLLASVGVRLLMQPGKGYSITMPRPDKSPSIPLHLAEARMAVTPMGDQLRFAGTMELSGLSTDINRRRVDAIRRGGFRYLATTERPSEKLVWAGLRPIAPDGMPYIGRLKEFKNLIVATGHAMLGVSMGPITGHLVAETVMGRMPPIDLTPFRPDRF